MAVQSWSAVGATLLGKPKLWQSWEMDHNLRCRGPIWVIQKHKIKFIDAATTSMKNMSPNSLCFPTENQIQTKSKVWGQNLAASS